VSPYPLSAEDIGSVRFANRAMSHRGPDGAGEYCDSQDPAAAQPHLFMAMRRLSIIDLDHGWQPLTNEDGSVAVIANGEIYNHVEVSAELRRSGHHLRTRSDCEVLPHLYEAYGLEFVHRLRGMFAFALWDQRKRRLVLGRDRMGEKPLYLHVTQRGIWFASELKVLLATGRVPFRLDAGAVDSYMRYGWIPEPRTAVLDVRKLPAGHLMVVDVDPWASCERSYWRLENAPTLEGDPVEQVRAELETVGRQIVRSDVPVGVALSGGFDSSLAAALAVKNAASDVHAFTVGYAGTPHQDERPLASTFAQRLGMKFHSLELTIDEMTREFPQLAFRRDDPIADIAGFGYFALSRHARAVGCPVLLQGQGADELLWGYPWARLAVEHSLRKLAGNPIGSLEALRASLPSTLSRSQWVRFAYTLGGLVAGWRQLSPAQRQGSSELVAYELCDTFQMGSFAAESTYTTGFREQLGTERPSPADSLERRTDEAAPDLPVDVLIIALLCRGYLLENGLAQGDRLSMANSVELRLPLVDYRLAEVLVGLQKSKPLYSDQPKRFLTEAAEGIVPREIVERPKRGFNPPVAAWTAALRLRYGRELLDGGLQEHGMLDRAAAARLLKASSRFAPEYDLFLKYLVLEFWFRGMHAITREVPLGHNRAMTERYAR
jgi:asparagine synthase (glutamine-hydrolysing)